VSNNPRISKAEYDEQTNSLYVKIGKIVVLSEHLNFAMYHCCCLIIEVKGLRQEYCQTVLVGMNLENMRRTWESLIKLYYSGDVDATGMINHVSARLDNIIRRRNETVHARWNIGWGNEQTENFETATSLKGKRSIGGKGFGGIKYTVTDSKYFDDIVSEIDKLHSILWRFSFCIHWPGRNTPPSANFSYDDKGLLVDKPP
jgi:hypothetical protein